MKAVLLLVAMLSLAGCAPTVYQPSAYSGSTTAQTSAGSLEQNRTTLRDKRQQLARARQQDEIDRLKKEIEELEARVSELEREQESAAAMPSRGYTGSGAVHTGPRGGKYTISPSGKKQYIRRK